MKRFIVVVIICLGSFVGWAQSRVDYIDRWKSVAMDQMNKYGIPASITLAQGILESGSGASELAQRAKNHFGIKCHNWDGPKVYHDDDERGECFRKYKNAAESYQDHSEFLKKQPRYAFLFELKPTDYKGWAKGLKKAGYATNPAYPKLLIKIIEEEELFRFDELVEKGLFKGVESDVKPADSNPLEFETEGDDRILVLEREKFLHPNRITFVKAETGETPQDIADEFELGLWQILKYNDVEEAYVFEEGEVIFIQPKRRKAQIEDYVVEKGDDLRSISQLFGVKIRRIVKMNALDSENVVLQEGDTLRLR